MAETSGPQIGSIVVQEGGPHLRDFIVGYLRTYARLEHALLHASPFEHDVEFRKRSWEALFEALNWADAIDQFMAHGDAGRGANPNWVANADAQTRGVLRALKHVRNVVHHQWWQALAVKIDMTGEKQVNTWVWGALPGRTRDTDGVQAYERHLHHRPARESLHVLRDALWRIRAWTISADDLRQEGCPLPPGIQLQDSATAERSVHRQLETDSRSR